MATRRATDTKTTDQKARNEKDSGDRDAKDPGPRNEKQPPTDDKRPPADEKQPPVDEKEPPVDEKKPPVDEKKPPTDDRQPPTDGETPPMEPPIAGQRTTAGPARSSGSSGDEGGSAGGDVAIAAGGDGVSSVRDIGIEGLATSGMRADVDRLAGTLDSRIAETISTEAATSSVEYGTGSVTSGGDAAQDVSSDAASSMPDVPRWNAVDQSTGRGSSTSSEQPLGEAAQAEIDSARDYLSQTGRWGSEEEVANMSTDELSQALESEATREYMGYDGPMDTATAEMWLRATDSAFDEQQGRDYLVSIGYDPGEVNMMDRETLRDHVIAEGEVAARGGEEGPPDGSGTGPQNGSMSLADRESGKTQVGAEEDEESSSGGESGAESGSGSGSDDDDDDDDDNNGSDTEATTDTGSGEGEEQGNSEGSGAAPASSTPRPDQDFVNPADRAAFQATPVGAASREADLDAIGAAMGGGLIVGDGEDPGARQAWFTSELSAGERALAAESVSMARGGGVTDPVEGETVEGVSDLDVTRLPNHGLIDPVDTGATGGTPIDPITGAPTLPPKGPVNQDLAGSSVVADDDTGSGVDDPEDDGAISDVLGPTAAGGFGDLLSSSLLGPSGVDLDLSAGVHIDPDTIDVDPGT